MARKKVKAWPCKVGTVPWVVVVWGNSRPKVGRHITFRDWKHGSGWQEGIVTRVNPDGYFFVEVV
jgi:hypothetical protein